jgi:uncharacterized protein YjiS (DUF1127 family)
MSMMNLTLSLCVRVIRRNGTKFERRSSSGAQGRVSRLELRSLGERDLCDVGLTRTDAETEPDKPFWRP